MNVVVTWMYSSPAHESIHHAQTGPNSGSQEVKNYYWRCVFLLFESSQRLNKGVRHILLLNELPPKEIDGIDISILIRQYNIEIFYFDNITISPRDYYGAWNTQFLIIDILEKLQSIVENDDAVMVLDSDVVFNRSIDHAFEVLLKNEQAMLYDINYRHNYKINGLTRLELLGVSRALNDNFPADDFIYSGGEFVCCIGSQIIKIAELARETYNKCLIRHEHGLDKFNEEAQLLSYVYHVLGYKNGTANEYIARIWTDRTIYTNINGSEKDLMLWHLPAEKKRGFVEVFNTYALVDGNYFIKTRGLSKKYRVIEPLYEKLHRQLANIKCRISKFLNQGSQDLRN
mgnify:CR=1 FL=1